MAKKSKNSKRATEGNENKSRVARDYRHKTAKRKNNPPAQMAAEGTVPAVPKATYSYNPHLPPVLRFDPNGTSDALPELLAVARTRPLTAEEVQALGDALRKSEPWLEWTEKREQHQRGSFQVDPVALHIHERVSTQAILKVAARQDVQRQLFADPQQEYHQAVQFYRHDIDWTNRLILGDAREVMSSLAKREDLAGKVQMIYIDPPYGIKFGSNFQPEIGQRDVKEREQDLTREPEVVKAYRDTYRLGIHSYLSYLRERMIVAKELLADTGSIFVQISDENVHRVRQVMDDVFQPQNYVAIIQFLKTTSATNVYLPIVADYVLWYARDAKQTRYRALYRDKVFGAEGAAHYNSLLLETGERRQITPDERTGSASLPDRARPFTAGGLDSASMGRDKGEGAACWFPVTSEGRTFTPNPKNRWKTNETGMRRLLAAERVVPQESTHRYLRFVGDFPAYAVNSVWTDVGGASDRVYVVQTADRVVERCMLMTTDPGDLVLDPTCGSGTTARVAEQWGRRWITIDTSRVAAAIARQRLMTARFDYYRLRPLDDEDRHRNPRGTWLSNGTDGTDSPSTFRCRSVPHITLKSIAQNTNLDPIFAKHELILNARLEACNAVLAKVNDVLRHKLERKLLEKQKAEGKKAITDADRRRWLLPPGNRDRSDEAKKRSSIDADSKSWYSWEVPFDTDPDWPKALADAVIEFRNAWRVKMEEVNACIAANAEQEELVDQPEIVRGVVRVSGPFTIEAVQPPEMSLGDAGPPLPSAEFAGAPGELETFHQVGVVEPRADIGTANAKAYLDQMIRLLRGDGVRFPNNKQMKFSRLDSIYASNATGLHAEGRWISEGETESDLDGPSTVAVSIGPQYGAVTAMQVVETVRSTFRRAYTDLVFAGFSFDATAQAEIEGHANPKLRVHMASIRPDVNPAMNGLLKQQPGSQLFTVFGLPRTKLDGPNHDDEYTVTMEGVDIYDPVENVVRSAGAEKVAAWFLDSDYDGRTFCITQAFFPDRSAWEKLARALNGKDGVIDAERFEALSGTVSLPFPVGPNRCVAVKVIDPRGNEVMNVHPIGR